MRMSLVIGMWILTWMAIAPTAGAQGRRGGALVPETLNTEATVRGARPGMLQVTSQENGDWLVTIPTEAENVVFRASATPQFLQPGLAVRFHTTFRKTDKRLREYQATRPISALQIITVLPNSMPGVYPDDAGGLDDQMFKNDDGDKDAEEEEEEKKKKQPAKKDGEKEQEQVREPAKKKEETKQKERGKDAAKEEVAAADDIPVLVIGLLREYKNNRIKVGAGNFLVSAELPETTEVSVDVRHCQWVRPGDKVELTARYYPTMRGRAEGQRMTITASQPLAPDEKASKARRRSGRDKKPDDAPKSVDDKDGGA